MTRGTLSKENIKDRVLVDERGCWIWQRATKYYPDKDFCYGWVTMNKKQMSAHRASWLIHNGEIPKGLFVCHKCDVPRCVNPEHLFLGTPLDNSRDMMKKARWTPAPRVFDSDTPRCMSKEQVFEIKALLNVGLTQKEIANKFNVSQPLISHIKNNKKWMRYV